MEAALVGPCLEPLRHLAFAREVAEPLAVLGIAEPVHGPGRDLFEPRPPARVAGGAPRHQGADHRLAVRPPELHRPLELQRAEAVCVEEVVEAAVLGVPASVERALHHRERVTCELLVVDPPRVLREEPRRLDHVARVEQPPLRRVDQAAVGRDVLAHQPPLAVEVQHHAAHAVPLDRVVVAAVVEGLRARRAAQLGDQVEQDHRHREILPSPLPRELRAAERRRVLDQREHALEQLQRAAAVRRVAAGPRILRVGHHQEALGEDLALQADRRAVARQLEERAPVRADRVRGQELRAEPCAVQQRPVVLVEVELGQHPDLPTLQPDVLVVSEPLPVAVELVEVAAVLLVERVPHPERQHALPQVGADPVAPARDLRVGRLRPAHDRPPPSRPRRHSA